MNARTDSVPQGDYLIVTARFNALVTERLTAGAWEVLQAQGIAAERIQRVGVPGTWELPPVVAAAARSGRYRAVVAIGAVIRGETPHFEHIARTAIDALGRIQTETLTPIGLGVLTTDTLEQALNRAGGKAGNKGVQAAQAALYTADVLVKFRP